MSDAQTAVVFPVSTQFGPRQGPFSRALAAAGEWLRIHAKTIRVVQWFVVVAYVFLIAVPAFMPLPTEEAHWYNSLAVLAQWLFWGVWWPFVILSMLVVGRAWCGLFCPEGTLTEAVSKFGLGRAVPHWMKWNGWPFVAFALTTVFGQLVSVYQYPTATLLVLGGSTVAAIAVGLVYGRSKRVWCRHLCPVNGVFSVLSRVAPVHFAVDTSSVERQRRAHRRASCELRADGAHPPHDGSVRMPHVRPLQRLARRDCAAKQDRPTAKSQRCASIRPTAGTQH